MARSPERGTAYFVDATDRRVIATENLRDGERVRINPDGDEITVDGRATTIRTSFAGTTTASGGSTETTCVAGAACPTRCAMHDAGRAGART